ncbi:hypothetical protein FRC03_008235 [Tulasnella sp. 419]|nr:hypothetical protein FRC03_008235 [Tulasnella sp. 419]
MYGLVRPDSFARRLHPSQDFQDISDRYQKWAPSTLSSEARVDEEQEREMVLEMEMERQVELPPKGNAVIPCVHDDVRNLVKTGVFKSRSTAFDALLQPLPGDSDLSFEADSWDGHELFSTRDFSITVEPVRHGNTNDYIRPVNWIVSTTGPGRRVFVVLSPHEVNELLPFIRRSTKVHLHQYAPRVTQEMKSFEDLAFHCIPPLGSSWTKLDIGVITRLNLWAGQLYIEDKAAYMHLCNFLGLYSQKPTEDDNLQPDGFIKPEHRRSSALSTCTFEQSQVPYLRRLFALRRKGMGYFPTHMGKILRGRLLENDDFC